MIKKKVAFPQWMLVMLVVIQGVFSPSGVVSAKETTCQSGAIRCIGKLQYTCKKGRWVHLNKLCPGACPQHIARCKKGYIHMCTKGVWKVSPFRCKPHCVSKSVRCIKQILNVCIDGVYYSLHKACATRSKSPATLPTTSIPTSVPIAHKRRSKAFRLRKGIFAGTWRSQPAQFHLTRQKGSQFDGSLLFLKGADKGKRFELTLHQDAAGDIFLTRYLTGSPAQKSHAAHLYYQKSVRGHLAVLVARLGSGMHDLVKLFVPIRWGFFYHLKPGTYTGNWHDYPAIFTLTKKTPKQPIFSGHMIYSGGRFEGQVTPITIEQLSHGRLLIRRDVGNGRQQTVKTYPPILYATGKYGIIKLEGPMKGHWGTGTGRIFLTWRAPKVTAR